MSRNVETPKVEKERDGERITHPAFGSIVLGRPTGSHARLFQSDQRHQHWICLEIYEADCYRSLNQDRVHPTREVVEVWLSEAQFASFVASAGIGAGTPCTIVRVMGKPVPEIGETEPRVALFDREIREHMAELTERVNDAQMAAAEAMAKMPAAHRKALEAMFDKLRQEIGPNLEFVQKQFARHMENHVEKAKAEIESYAFARLKGLPEPAKQIEQGETGDEKNG